jgi:gluconolactonase
MQQLATGYGLIEGPVWDPAKGLYFSDVPNGGVFLLDRQDRVSQAIPRRRGIGGIALHAEGGLIVGGRDVAWVGFDGGLPRPILTQGQIPDCTGFNDLTTDAAGRVYIGSLAFRVFGGDDPKPGKLHVIDLDGTMRTLSDGVLLTNGLGFSPDGRRLYHSDSRSNLVRAYDVLADGSVRPWRTFAHLGEGGVPDGLKVAQDGSVWVADARGGRVAVFNADGSHRMDLPVPLPMVTSVCFGGEDLKDLYVVTGSDGAPSEASGTVFRIRAEVAGLPLPPARVAIPQAADATA